VEKVSARGAAHTCSQTACMQSDSMHAVRQHPMLGACTCRYVSGNHVVCAGGQGRQAVSGRHARTGGVLLRRLCSHLISCYVASVLPVLPVNVIGRTVTMEERLCWVCLRRARCVCAVCMCSEVAQWEGCAPWPRCSDATIVPCARHRSLNCETRAARDEGRCHGARQGAARGARRGAARGAWRGAMERSRAALSSKGRRVNVRECTWARERVFLCMRRARLQPVKFPD
jgi:hypothetical protein